MSNNKEIKKSMDKYFNKDDNYKEILKHMDKEDKKSRIWRYSLVPIMLIIVIGGVLLGNRNLNDDIKEVLSQEKSFIDGKKVISLPSSNSQSDKLLSEEFATLVNHSDVVVKGEVLSVDYLEVDGNAWTKIRLRIDDIFKGNIAIDDIIEIYYIGGYISLEEHIKSNDDAFRFANLSEEEIKNTVLKETYDGENEFVKKGENLILCLVKNTPEYPFPKNSYQRLYAAGMLKEQGNKYVQLYGEVEEKYSVDKEKINDIKKLIKKD